FSSSMLNRYTDHLRDRGLLDAYRRHITDRAYQGDNETGANATKRVPMWDATPMPVPLDAYIDAWHGREAVRWIEEYDRAAPFILRPPGGCTPRVVESLIEHVDVPASVREIGGAPEIDRSEGRSLLGYLRGDDPPRREVAVSENWGFACFETDRYKLVVDEDA